MVLSRLELGENSNVMVLSLSSDKSLVGIPSKVLVEQELVLKMSVDWSQDSNNRGLLKSESNIMSLVVPQMVNSVFLSVIEILLVAVSSLQVSRLV